METSFQKLAFTALLLGLAAACSGDEEGVTIRSDAFDAGGEGVPGAPQTVRRAAAPSFASIRRQRPTLADSTSIASAANWVA
jgi:hypothetical protein